MKEHFKGITDPRQAAKTNYNLLEIIVMTVTTEETRYFITSLCDVKQFAHAVRSHWGIESVHWCLDVVFHEDACRTRKDNSAENFAVIRHMAINILKQHPAKMSLARKRRKCGYDIEFMRDVLIALVS